MAGNITAQTLTLAVNNMEPVKTPVLDTVFGRKVASTDTNNIEIVIRKGSKKLMAPVAVDAAATVTTTDSLSKISVPAPRFAEKELITAAKLSQIDAAMGRGFKSKLKEEVAFIQRDKKATFDLTREFMAVKALSGQVVDESGTVLADYSMPAELKPTLSGAALWTGEDADPIADIRNWKRLIAQHSGGAITGWVAYAGEDALSAMRKNPQVLELAKSQLGSQVVENGHLKKLAQVEIHDHEVWYTASDNSVKTMVPANVFILVGLCADGAAESYCPVVDLEAPGGVGKDGQPKIFFSKMWDVEDPSGKYVKVEGRPLPTLGRLISCYATVTA